MGRKPITRTCLCVDCGARDELGARNAAKLGWLLWPGGGRCPTCEKKRAPRAIESQAAAVAAGFPRPPTIRLVKVVRCSACDREFEAENEHTDGWWPSLHWIVTEETKRALREDRKPIPLCPGIKKAGVLVGERAKQ